MAMTGLTGVGLQLVPADVSLLGVKVNLLGTGVNLPGSGVSIKPSSGPSPPVSLPLGFLPAGALSTPNVNVGSHAALQWERTQPWSFNCQVQIPGPPTVVAGGGGTAAILFTTCNQGSGTVFTGYEIWIDGSGFLRIRLINNVGTAIFLGAIGTVSLCDNNLHNIGVTYTGSGVVAGVSAFVDGNVYTLTTESDTLGANTIVNTQPFVIGNQLGFPFSLGGSMKNPQLSNIVRSQAYCAAYTTPVIDANVVLAYNFSEGSGTTVHDLSANGFNGTVNSAQWPAVSGSVSIIPTDNAQSANAAAMYTFARAIAVVPGPMAFALDARIGANTTAVASSLTFNSGAIIATLIPGSDSRNTSGGALSTTSFWTATIPPGTTSATVAATFSATMARAAIEAFSIVGSNGVVPSGAAVANMTGTSAGAVGTVGVTIPTNGAALIVGSLSAVTGNPGLTPTNYAPHGGPVNLASTMWYASGSDNTAGARSYTMTWTGTSPSIPTMTAAAWSS